jgi:hypothetical protein
MRFLLFFCPPLSLFFTSEIVGQGDVELPFVPPMRGLGIEYVVWAPNT